MEKENFLNQVYIVGKQEKPMQSTINESGQFRDCILFFGFNSAIGQTQFTGVMEDVTLFSSIGLTLSKMDRLRLTQPELMFYSDFSSRFNKAVGMIRNNQERWGLESSDRQDFDNMNKTDYNLNKLDDGYELDARLNHRNFSVFFQFDLKVILENIKLAIFDNLYQRK